MAAETKVMSKKMAEAIAEATVTAMRTAMANSVKARKKLLWAKVESEEAAAALVAAGEMLDEARAAMEKAATIKESQAFNDMRTRSSLSAVAVIAHAKAAEADTAARAKVIDAKKVATAAMDWAATFSD
ncbi:MAG: hypothetical protein Hyperionvirus4_109 [Hyperionvirus sp.]|uniref:Uncharacterized protein n=1 Tax=Hyperionvirus sp. TaxID=2487770 RepID=A0A3G5A9I6_9VIRU|nr:MAG: hypothetical protein Hyperionvirus4_109 [Hyperionvirus sp.]